MRTLEIKQHKTYSVATVEFSSYSKHLDEEVKGWEKVLIGKIKQGCAYFAPADSQYSPHPSTLEFSGTTMVQYVEEFKGFLLLIEDYDLMDGWYNKLTGTM